MGKKASAVEEIAGLIPETVPRSWWHRVAPEHQSTLADIREAFAAGKFRGSKTSAAKAIAQWLNANGISQVGFQGVLEWLAR